MKILFITILAFSSTLVVTDDSFPNCDALKGKAEYTLSNYSIQGGEVSKGTLTVTNEKKESKKAIINGHTWQCLEGEKVNKPIKNIPENCSLVVYQKAGAGDWRCSCQKIDSNTIECKKMKAARCFGYGLKNGKFQPGVLLIEYVPVGKLGELPSGCTEWVKPEVQNSVVPVVKKNAAANN